MDSYAARLRDHLAASRRRNLPFEHAWARAQREVRGTGPLDAGWTPSVLKFAKRVFREGYYRRDVCRGLAIAVEGDDTGSARLTNMAIGARVA